MPNCFNLTRKSDLEAGPVALQQIDQEMCDHFRVKCDPKLYYFYWYNTIDFGLACGHSFEAQRAEAESFKVKAVDADDLARCNRQIEIIDWLDTNFTTNAWAEIGKR